MAALRSSVQYDFDLLGKPLSVENKKNIKKMPRYIDGEFVLRRKNYEGNDKIKYKGKAPFFYLRSSKS